jgi:hypothetical protein
VDNDSHRHASSVTSWSSSHHHGSHLLPPSIKPLPGNPSAIPLSFSLSRAAAPIFPLFFLHPLLLLHKTNTNGEPPSPPRHGAIAAGHPASRRGHQEIRGVVLYILVQGIVSALPQSTAKSLIPRSVCRTPATFLAASVLPRPNQRHHRLPSEFSRLLAFFPILLPFSDSQPALAAVFARRCRCRRCSGESLDSAPPPTGSSRRGAMRGLVPRRSPSLLRQIRGRLRRARLFVQVRSVMLHVVARLLLFSYPQSAKLVRALVLDP